jgi:hypothetical protein
MTEILLQPGCQASFTHGFPNYFTYLFMISTCSEGSAYDIQEKINWCYIPLNSLKPNFNHSLFGQLLGWGIFFIKIWHLYTGFFPSLPAIANTLNSDSVWARGEFLYEKSWKCNFLQFLCGSQLSTHGSNFEVGGPLICPKKVWFTYTS